LTNDKSEALYSCMRANCGPECGVPSCDVDPSVILFANPACDRCIGGSCCETINACYQNRRCKLAVECIATNCTRTLGPAMTELGALPGPALTAIREAACNGERPAAGAGAGACIM